LIDYKKLKIQRSRHQRKVWGSSRSRNRTICRIRNNSSKTIN